MRSWAHTLTLILSGSYEKEGAFVSSRSHNPLVFACYAVRQWQCVQEDAPLLQLVCVLASLSLRLWARVVLSLAPPLVCVGETVCLSKRSLFTGDPRGNAWAHSPTENRCRLRVFEHTIVMDFAVCLETLERALQRHCLTCLIHFFPRECKHTCTVHHFNRAKL
jgi:hypothetical protein